MIRIHPEPKGFSTLAGPLEQCFFCNTPTNMWNRATNQPVCKTCSLKHEQDELTLSHPDYKPPKQRKPATEPKQRKLNLLLNQLVSTAKSAGKDHTKFSYHGLKGEKAKHDNKMSRTEKLIEEIMILAMS